MPYVGFNHSLDCGDNKDMAGGCVFNVREDPNETKDLAAELPDVRPRSPGPRPPSSRRPQPCSCKFSTPFLRQIFLLPCTLHGT